MYELPLTQRYSSSNAPDLSFIIRFSQSTWLFPSIYKCAVISPALSFSVPHKKLHHFLATLQQALKEISLILDRKRLYLLFQWCLSWSRFSLVYFSFHSITALKLLSQIPSGPHMDQQHLTHPLSPSLPNVHSSEMRLGTYQMLKMCCSIKLTRQ